MRKKIGVNIIAKRPGFIYYELAGSLDNRLGISYYPDESKVEKDARKIREHWYH